MSVVTASCKRCGKEFKFQDASNPTRKYCSRRCVAEDKGTGNRSAVPEMSGVAEKDTRFGRKGEGEATCARCGKEFRWKGSDTPYGDRPTHCSTECARKTQRMIISRVMRSSLRVADGGVNKH